MIKCHRAGCFASKPGKPKTPEQTIRKKLMPVLLYLTFLSKRMWNVADEVSPTPDCTHLLFYFIFCRLVSHPWRRVRRKKRKKKRLSTWHEGTDGTGQMEMYHRWLWRIEGLYSLSQSVVITCAPWQRNMVRQLPSLTAGAPKGQTIPENFTKQTPQQLRLKNGGSSRDQRERNMRLIREHMLT